MFWDKKCKGCNSKIKSEWAFCPSCGVPLRETKKVSSEFDKEPIEIGRMPEMNIPNLMFKPFMKDKGISITITADNNAPPRIEVVTSGDQRKHHHHEAKPVRLPKITEEPEMKVEQEQNKDVITLNLPDVKSLNDIDIKQLDQSIEIKAFAGDKAYFKLIPIPSNATVNNQFKDGVLKIEIQK
ncbi:MAG: hypothetical protein HYW23_00340 [Candidatus Aenigmarchaeota archaeon]|nr:hypothetical protein [Candidatus Aenigmarchaeota archaeon]